MLLLPLLWWQIKKKKHAKADVKEPMAYVFLLGERRTYGNFFYHKLIDHIYMDLFLGSLFCFIDLWSVFLCQYHIILITYCIIPLIKYFQYYNIVLIHSAVLEYYQLYLKFLIYIIILHHLDLYYVHLLLYYRNH